VKADGWQVDTRSWCNEVEHLVVVKELSPLRTLSHVDGAVFKSNADTNGCGFSDTSGCGDTNGCGVIDMNGRGDVQTQGVSGDGVVGGEKAKKGGKATGTAKGKAKGGESHSA
jgi:hypothetical protein